MNVETAHKINSALCRVWFCAEVTGNAPESEDVALLKQTSLGQAETATDVVQAENAAKLKAGPGPYLLRCYVDPGRIPSLLQLVQTMT